MLDTDTIKGCLRNDPDAQKALYDELYELLINICIRYSKNADEAKNMFHQGILNIFQKLHDVNPHVVTAAWAKQLMIDSSIAYLKRNKQEYLIVSTVRATASPESNKEVTDEEMLKHADQEDILKALQDLVPAYRVIYNLHEIDGYSHRQISEKLNIGEETSRSNLSKAKYHLRRNLANFINIPR